MAHLTQRHRCLLYIVSKRRPNSTNGIKEMINTNRRKIRTGVPISPEANLANISIHSWTPWVMPKAARKGKVRVSGSVGDRLASSQTTIPVTKKANP
jgi:hypothetical protein